VAVEGGGVSAADGPDPLKVGVALLGPPPQPEVTRVARSMSATRGFQFMLPHILGRPLYCGSSTSRPSSLASTCSLDQSSGW
jgi:hypothetical protein